MDWPIYPTPQIDFEYDALKAGRLPGQGYDARPPNAALLGIIWHSTNGLRGSRFAYEATYIRDSPLVKAHYLVGEDGRISRILDPSWRAWHCGASSYQGWINLNDVTIGVEAHHSIGTTWPARQLAACAWLFRTLRADHPTLQWIAAHRDVAMPLGRKVDPSDLSDQFIAGFIAAL